MVKAGVYRRGHASGPPVKLDEGYHMVKMLPAMPEDAPLDITYRDER